MSCCWKWADLSGRTHASQGEQRSLALALRLAGHQLVTGQDRECADPPPRRCLLRARSGPGGSACWRCLPAGQAIVTTAGCGSCALRGTRSPCTCASRTGSCSRDHMAAGPAGLRGRRPAAGGRVSGPGHPGLGAPPARVLAAVFSRWETVVGAEIAAHAEPRVAAGWGADRARGPAGLGGPAALSGG